MLPVSENRKNTRFSSKAKWDTKCNTARVIWRSQSFNLQNFGAAERKEREIVTFEILDWVRRKTIVGPWTIGRQQSWKIQWLTCVYNLVRCPGWLKLYPKVNWSQCRLLTAAVLLINLYVTTVNTTVNAPKPHLLFQTQSVFAVIACHMMKKSTKMIKVNL